MLPHSPRATSLSQQRAICMRDLARLQRLRWQSILRALQARAARGGAGFMTGLFAAMKVKIAATLSGKLIFAALIAMGFVWPSLIVWSVIIGVLATIAAIFGFELGPDDLRSCCFTGTNERRARLMAMIRERKRWLRKPQGPMPSRRSNGSDG